MKKLALTIYDMKAQVYNNPWFAINEQTAIRMCTDLANDPSLETGRHPEDFVCYIIGEFDDNEGVYDVKEWSQLCNFAQLVQEQTTLASDPANNA